jgi:hypothetical protein
MANYLFWECNLKFHLWFNIKFVSNDEELKVIEGYLYHEFYAITLEILAFLKVFQTVL